MNSYPSVTYASGSYVEAEAVAYPLVTYTLASVYPSVTSYVRL